MGRSLRSHGSRSPPVSCKLLQSRVCEFIMHVVVVRNRRVVGLNVRPGRWAPHAQIIRAYTIYTPPEYRYLYLYGRAARAECKRSHAEPLRCVSHAGEIALWAGCCRRSAARSAALAPSVTVQAVTTAAWVVTHKTEAKVRVSSQSVGWSILAGRSCLTIAP